MDWTSPIASPREPVTHADGRTRYHGQRRRRQQPRIQLDQQDLGDAIKHLQRAQAAMAYAQLSEVQALPRCSGTR